MIDKALGMSNSFRRFTLIVLALVFCLCLVYPASGDDEERKLKELEAEINAHQKKLKEIKRTESSILDELEKTNIQLLGIESDLQKQRRILKETEAGISRLNAEIARLSAKLDKQRQWMRRKLRAVYRYGNFGDVILLIAASENVSQLMRRLEYLQRLAAHERKIIEGFKADLNVLGDKQKTVEGLYVKLKRQEQNIQKTAEDLTTKKRQKEMTLASIKSEKTLQERLLREMEEASKKLLEVIRKSEEVKTFPVGKFRELKGKLPWPVSGELALPYGRQKDPQFNTPTFRNGIYIKTTPSSIAKSVSDGAVVYAQWFRGYGQLVIVNHGDGYHSLYANLSEIFLKVGDIIKRDTAVGRVGESIVIDAPSLYFEIRYKGKPLDPMQWLKTR